MLKLAIDKKPHIIDKIESKYLHPESALFAARRKYNLKEPKVEKEEDVKIKQEFNEYYDENVSSNRTQMNEGNYQVVNRQSNWNYDPNNHERYQEYPQVSSSEAPKSTHHNPTTSQGTQYRPEHDGASLYTQLCSVQNRLNQLEAKEREVNSEISSLKRSSETLKTSVATVSTSLNKTSTSLRLVVDSLNSLALHEEKDMTKIYQFEKDMVILQAQMTELSRSLLNLDQIDFVRSLMNRVIVLESLLDSLQRQVNPQERHNA